MPESREQVALTTRSSPTRCTRSTQYERLFIKKMRVDANELDGGTYYFTNA